MKSLHEIILEKLKIRKSSYKYFPKTKEELLDIIDQLIEERGNKGDFNNIDTSKITNMRSMFSFCKSFNCDISNWNVSNVKDYDEIFYNCAITEKYKPKFK